MENDEIDGIVSWYKLEFPFYEAFASRVKNIVEDILDSQGINYHTVQARPKKIESFEQKLQKGVSYDPKRMQDLVGVRIIGYVNSDMQKISKTIEDHFVVDPKKNTDRSDTLGIDKVGYRSRHFVVTLSKSRTSLPENKKYEGIPFEIQVRTILQHAWAEIEHDRNYKYSGILPLEIQREFNLLSGTLELIDNEFERISQLIETYSNEVSTKTKKGDLDIPINSTSLKQFMLERFSGVKMKTTERLSTGGPETNIIEELNSMGIITLADLDKIIQPKLKDLCIKREYSATIASLIRIILIAYDVKMFFEKAWKKHHFNRYSNDSLEITKELGVDPLIIKKYLRIG